MRSVGWRRHSSLIFFILLFTKPYIEGSGWLYQTKTLITRIVYQPFSRVMPPDYIALGLTINSKISTAFKNRNVTWLNKIEVKTSIILHIIFDWIQRKLVKPLDNLKTISNSNIKVCQIIFCTQAKNQKFFR